MTCKIEINGVYSLKVVRFLDGLEASRGVEVRGHVGHVTNTTEVPLVAPTLASLATMATMATMAC